MKKLLPLTLGIALAGTAIANEDVTLIKQLFEAGQSIEAYELGLELQGELEGNPQFDYYFGAAAVDSGDASQGVFALERTLIQQPNNQAARLELARGYYELEEYQRSRKEFEAVMKANPPAEVEKKVQTYLDAIRRQESRYRSTAQGFFRIGLGSDSNANAATDDTQLNDLTPALAAIVGTTLAPQSRAADSSFTDIAAGTNLTLPMTPNWTLKTGTSIQATIYNDEIASDFNTATLNFQAGVDQKIGEHTLSYGLTHQSLVLADDFFRNTSNFLLGWRFKPTENSQLSAYGRLLQTENELKRSPNDVPSTRDIDGQSFGINYLRQLEGKLSPVVVAGITFGSEEPQSPQPTLKANLERDYYGFNLGGQITLNQRNALAATLNWQTSEYGAPNIGFQNKTRDDDLTAMRIEHNFLMNKHWKLNSYASVTNNSSNISISDYDRTRFGINFIYETN